jgi:hypothetical protein
MRASLPMDRVGVHSSPITDVATSIDSSVRKCSVELGQSKGVLREMARNPVENDSNAFLVAAIDEMPKLVRIPKTARWRIITGDIRLSPQSAQATHGRVPDPARSRDRTRADRLSADTGRHRPFQAAVPTYCVVLKQPDKQKATSIHFMLCEHNRRSPYRYRPPVWGKEPRKCMSLWPRTPNRQISLPSHFRCSTNAHFSS